MSISSFNKLPQYFSIIIALGPNGEFGYKNNLPWEPIIEDISFFYKTTITSPNLLKKNVVIMGRKTFESIGSPLKSRINMIVTRSSQDFYTYDKEPGLINYCTSLDHALYESGQLVKLGKINKIFVIGGHEILKEAIKSRFCEEIICTRINPKQNVNINSDVSFEIPLNQYSLTQETTQETDKFNLSFQRYKQNISSPEDSYLNLLKTVISTGKTRSNRTNIDTLSITGGHLEVEMYEYGFPLFTTKRVYFKGIVHELLFFISGKTQTKVLEDKNVNIWKGNTSRSFLDKSEYNFINKLKEGDMGNGYGFQWRHFGAVRSPNEQLEIGQGGFDQLSYVIEGIKTVIKDPSSSLGRRLVISAWNPVDLDKQALPPCHMLVQFIVNFPDKEKEESKQEQIKLDCCVTMRSNDGGCGTPFNVSSYALLTYMICNVINYNFDKKEVLVPGKLVINMHDMHVYKNHIEGINEMFKRTPRIWPTLKITRDHSSIDNFLENSFELTDYYPHPEIKMEMAV